VNNRDCDVRFRVGLLQNPNEITLTRASRLQQCAVIKRVTDLIAVKHIRLCFRLLSIKSHATLREQCHESLLFTFGPRRRLRSLLPSYKRAHPTFLEANTWNTAIDLKQMKYI